MQKAKKPVEINEAKVRESWEPIIESVLGNKYTDALKEWLPTYCYHHNISENANNTVTNTQGMGAVLLPDSPGDQFDFYSQGQGSGDKPVSYLAMSMQIAADTPGLNCVPIVPAYSSLSILTYVDFLYAGGFTDSVTDIPSVWKLDATLPAGTLPGAIATFQDAGPTTVLVATYIGNSRLDGWPIFVTKSIANTYTIDSALAAAAVQAAAFRQSDDGTTSGEIVINSADAKLVRVLEDHISGFSGVLFSKLAAAATPADSVAAMKFNNMPYSRAEGERTNTRSLGMKFTSKSVKAETWEVDIATTREQLDDSREFGFDITGKAQKLLVNESTQAISKNIIDRIFALGAKNHKQIFDATGQHFNVNFDFTAGLGQTTFVLGQNADGTGLVTITTPSAVPPAKSTGGGETLQTAQHRIVQQVLRAANYIEKRGRREAGNHLITNSDVCTMLVTVAGFVAAPFQNTLRKNAGLRMMGTLHGIAVYMDPNMHINDTRIAIFRKGDGETPGLVYMPYRIADIVQTIAENTMAPKWQLKSRGKIVEAGHNPQLYYITLKINVQNSLFV